MGGYDAVQMRTVAEKADVAVGNLYRYFPSKVHLLVTAMARELGRVEGRWIAPSCAARPPSTACATC